MTTHEWFLVGISLFGVIGQMWVAAKRKGADDQKLRENGASILNLQDDVKDHETRISRIEGRFDVPRHGAH